MIAKPFKILAVVTAGLIVLAGFNVPSIYAMFWVAPEATVWLKGCNGEPCAIHGTLRAVPWSDGAYELTSRDGGTTRLPKGSYWKMQYPAKQS